MTLHTAEVDFFVDVQGTVQPRYPEVPGNRPTAPETSQAAAVAIKPDARSLRDAVLRVLRTGDYTADETADALGCCVLAIRPRFSELRALARIEDTGIRRKNSTGKFACVWRLATLLFAFSLLSCKPKPRSDMDLLQDISTASYELEARGYTKIVTTHGMTWAKNKDGTYSGASASIPLVSELKPGQSTTFTIEPPNAYRP